MSAPDRAERAGVAAASSRLSSRPLATIVLAGGLGGLYLATLTRDHSLDSVIYAGNAELWASLGRGGLRLLNPAHVLHTLTGAVLAAGLRGLAVPVSTLGVLQGMSALGAALMAAALHRFLLARTDAPCTATATVAALGVSGGVWAYAIQGEPNLVALAFAAAALLPLASVMGGPEEGTGGRTAVALAGVLLGLAAAFHLTLGTLWIGVLVCTPWRDRRRATRVLAALALAGAVLAAAYLPRALLLRSVEGAGPLDLVTFSSSPYGSYLGRTPFAPLAEAGATVAAFAPPAGGAVLRVAARLAWLIPCGWILAACGGLVAPWRGRAGGGRLLAVAAVWFLANDFLYAAWAERNFEFTSFLLVPLAVAGALGTARLLGVEGSVRAGRDRAAGAFLAAGGALAAAVVFLGTVRPGLDARSLPLHEVARMVADRTEPGDTVLVAGGPESRYKVYIPYFARRRVIVPDFFYGPSITPEESARRMEAKVAGACRQGKVYALGEIAAPLGLDTFEGIPYGRIRAWVRTLDPRPVARTGEGVVLWRLERCPS